jgi:hypothetical protein
MNGYGIISSDLQSDMVALNFFTSGRAQYQQTAQRSMEGKTRSTNCAITGGIGKNSRFAIVTCNFTKQEEDSVASGNKALAYCAR